MTFRQRVIPPGYKRRLAFSRESVDGFRVFWEAVTITLVVKFPMVSYWRFMGGSDRNTSNLGRSAQTVHDMQSVQSRINTGYFASR
jgi:hypothetical protein